MSGPSRNYVLLCEEGKRYVGTTTQMLARVGNHSVLDGAMRGQGAAWLKRYPMVDILLVQPGGLLEEATLTLAQMRTYGWQNVRGAAWTSVDMLHAPLELAAVGDMQQPQQQSLEPQQPQSLELQRHLQDACFKCGAAGHYAHSCPAAGKAPPPLQERFVCYKCHQPGHSQQFCSNVPAKDMSQQRASSAKQSGCLVCSSPDHWARACPERRCFQCNGRGHNSADCPKEMDTKAAATTSNHMNQSEGKDRTRVIIPRP